MKKILKNNFWLILLIFISLIPLFDLFRPGLPLTHDGQDHVARIANFYQNLAEGNLVPRWAGNLNWGYGHPVLMFLYPLSSYIGSFVHFLGFDFVASTKIVFGSAFILSGIFMYLWVKEFLGKEAGFVAGLLYMFAPYRFVDLYVRGAIGEHVAFVWPPLILYFLFKLAQTGSWWYVLGGSLSLASLILSHNALSLMFLPIIFGYIVYLIYFSRKKILTTKYYLLTTILSFSLSAFFWFPAVLEAKYTLRDIVTKDNITGLENFSRFLWSPWSYGGTGSLSVQVGILQWLGILVAPFLIWFFWKRKDKVWIFLTFLFISFWVAIFLMTPSAEIVYSKITLLQKFQFAWRFLSLVIFPPAVFLGSLIYLFPKKIKLLVTCGMLLVSLLLNKDYWHAQNFLIKPESFYTGIYPGTTDTGESSPRWSVRFMEKEPKAYLEVIDGEAQIKVGDRKSTEHKYVVDASVRSRLRENTLYFPGWEVLVDGQKTSIEFQDPQNRGLMTFYIEPGEDEIIVRFTQTRLRQLADAISIVAIFLLFSLPIFKNGLLVKLK